MTRQVAVGVCLAASTVAGATEVTDMAPERGVRALVQYGGSRLTGGLVEQGIRIADRRFERHDLGLQLELSPLRGASLTLGLDGTPSQSWTFDNARPMILDPLTGSGTYLTAADLAGLSDDGIGAPTGDPEVEPAIVGDTYGFRASGLNGVWIGVAVAPFSQTYARNQATNWRLDVAFRTPSKGNNLWSVRDNGNRGTSPGGSALRLQGAWSADLGVGVPYLTASWNKENKVTLDIVDATGATVARGLTLRPASTLQSTVGIEIDAWEDDAGSKFALDLFGGFGYRSWEDVATGVYLPETLDLGQTIPVTTSESIFVRAGAGVNVHGGDHVLARAQIDASYGTPYRLEHLYDVSTTWDSWTLGWRLTFGGQGALPERAD
jgi:hypothetical protein